MRHHENGRHHRAWSCADCGHTMKVSIEFGWCLVLLAVWVVVGLSVSGAFADAGNIRFAFGLWLVFGIPLGAIFITPLIFADYFSHRLAFPWSAVAFAGFAVGLVGVFALIPNLMGGF